MSAPKRSDAKPTPTAVLRPSSAAASPMNPIWFAWMSFSPIRYSQPSDVDRTREPGECAGDRHREEVVARDRDAAVARGLGVEADGAHLEAERRAVDDHPVDEQHRDRDEDPDRQPLEQLGSPQKTGSFAPSTMSFEIGIETCSSSAAGRPGRTRYEPTQIEIQFSMIVEITSCAPTVAFRIPAIPAYTAPASVRRRSRHERRRARRGPGRERRAEPDGEDRAGEVLALAADVEHAAAERERDRERREDDRRRQQQRLLQVLCRDRRGVPREPHVRVANGSGSNGCRRGRTSSGRCLPRSPCRP